MAPPSDALRTYRALARVHIIVRTPEGAILTDSIAIAEELARLVYLHRAGPALPPPD